MTGSLAYRKNEAAILSGDVPEKYLRLLPHIPHGRIVEMGSAEGVLALLLAKRGDKVTAVEANPERHASALKLAETWDVKARFLNKRAEQVSFAAHDVLVAVRMIYYLGDQLDAVFAKAAKSVSTIVLCGNKNRAARWKAGVSDPDSNANDYYASIDGMRAVLERHGYTVTKEITDGDPIVVGRLDRPVADPVQDQPA